MNPTKRMKASSFFLLLSGILLFGCKKETEELQVENPQDYISTQSGKYITYRVDSTVFTNFGATTVVRSYQEKHQVDVQISDNLGRPAYRVFRYLRDTAGARAWQPNGSYFITPVNNTVEVVENNLRFLKLAAPVKEGKTWKGNQFLPDDAYTAFYDFSNDDGMSDWEYSYAAAGESLTLAGKKYTDVATVLQVDESTNAPVTNPSLYGFRNYSVEKYAKGLGLVYQEYVMWEYQPPTSPRPGYRGFGVKRTIIDRN